MLSSDQFRSWATTILGVIIILVDLGLFVFQVWQGGDKHMGASEWTMAAGMLSAGMMLLGYKFKVSLADLVSWRKKP